MSDLRILLITLVSVWCVFISIKKVAIHIEGLDRMHLDGVKRTPFAASRAPDAIVRDDDLSRVFVASDVSKIAFVDTFRDDAVVTIIWDLGDPIFDLARP